MKYHIRRKFRPAAPHSDDTLCGLHANSVWLCRYDVPPVGVLRSPYYMWINSRHMMDVAKDAVCKTCSRIVEGRK